MIFTLEWSRVIRLRDASKQNMIYSVALEKIPAVRGIYIFGRRFGTSFEALYVGQAKNIRGRVKDQLNNVRLMQHLKNAKAGKRIVLAGQLKGQRGRRKDTALDLVERAFIRHFLSEGSELVNKQGVKIRRHEINSNGKYPKRYLPSLIYLER
jgi:hypothetical protein